MLTLIILLFSTLSVSESKPNFVIFLADDLGYGDIGCFGNSTLRTPNIDSLAKNGVKLNHHLAAAAVCTPSRAALLTGRYPVRAGMESSNRNKVFFFVAASGGLPENETTFARALKQGGYATAIIGKWHLGNDCNFKGDACHHPIKHGFDYFYGLPLSNFKDFGDDGQSVITSYIPNFYSYITAIILIGISMVYFTYSKHKMLSIVIFVILIFIPIITTAFCLNLKTINGILMQDMEVIEQPVRLQGLTQRFVHKAKLFIEQQVTTKTPFLLYVPFVHVHTALFCSSEFRGKSKHGLYGDNVEEMDWAVGEIVNKLKDNGILNNTFIYFSSDNGAHIEEVSADGEREGGYNGKLKGGKMMGGMEGGIRVPSIISWSKGISNAEITAVTSQMDLFPTIMELADIPLPQRLMDGKSLVPLLKGKSHQQHKYLFHYCGKQIHAATYVSGKKIWKLHWTTPKFIPGTNRCEYVCHCFGKFVIHHNPPILYDLSNDPSESQPKNISTNSEYSDIIFKINEARNQHEATVMEVPDQFSFFNTLWKPWLQPCCNFPQCKCTDLDFPA
ncbi:LOW QUALITY PROTEIN: steryl-sulfatase-like [Uloborus diversus]|uniref:LOW QUALITY PROTEIN: steryl-sulfatase-like n=1 Tax=Uloborus diversus TaxID=327109 RepID=UPI0024098F90|nr:LOW QUALITY PROTEIN: steryl-sulfatase-like [Uloborus diversus]